MGSTTSGMQPMWVKKPTSGLLCGHCGDTVQMDGYGCDTEQLIFHSKRIQMADINECPFCGNQFQPQSPAVVRTSPAITECKSSTPPTTNVDSDRSADSVTHSHGPEKAGINITWSYYPVDIIAESKSLHTCVHRFLADIACDERHDDEDFM
ncbi:hypothetical protein EG68_11380 [Paragonimus skrjabini miyazakii]|uniref:Uncharacterized protein n=1 Tax=Paragonimus skrjabini miyazakii TaxID=59628 RepID=A0A8S9YL42_9TREM|nr:hypothetical protein EG68_11380 [Paragonimus skrjabini miyazakii]